MDAYAAQDHEGYMTTFTTYMYLDGLPGHVCQDMFIGRVMCPCLQGTCIGSVTWPRLQDMCIGRLTWPILKGFIWEGYVYKVCVLY